MHVVRNHSCIYNRRLNSASAFEFPANLIPTSIARRVNWGEITSRTKYVVKETFNLNSFGVDGFTKAANVLHTFQSSKDLLFVGMVKCIQLVYFIEP